jgi:predicted outer membrane protein
MIYNRNPERTAALRASGASAEGMNIAEVRTRNAVDFNFVGQANLGAPF